MLFYWFRKNIDSLIAAIIAFIVIYVLTTHNGVGISPDSIIYISTAKNLHNGNGLYTFSQEALINFPVFYPIFLCLIITISHFDILQFAPLLNSFLFAVIIFLSGCIIEKFVQISKWYKWMVLSILVFSPSLLEIYSMLWSETLFIFFTLLFFLAFKNYLLQHSIKALLLAATIAALAFVTRYAGITLVGTGGLLLLVDIKTGWKKKITHLLIFGCTGISLAVLNLTRNLIITGTLAGKRQSGVTAFSKNMEYVGSVFCDWISVLREHYSFAFLIGMIVLIVFVLIFVVQSFSCDYFDSYEKILTAFFIVYTAFILLSSTFSRYETINNRLLSPAFIPFIIGLSYPFAVFIKKSNRQFLKMIIAFTMIVFFTSFQYFQYKWDAQYYQDIVDDGIPGYSETYWKSTPIVQLIQKDSLLAKRSDRFYSNRDHAVYFFTGLKTSTVPERVHDKEVEEFYKQNDFYIVWFLEDDNPDLLSIDEIKQHKKMDTVHLVKDGIIFHCTNY